MRIRPLHWCAAEIIHSSDSEEESVVIGYNYIVTSRLFPYKNIQVARSRTRSTLVRKTCCGECPSHTHAHFKTGRRNSSFDLDLLLWLSQPRQLGAHRIDSQSSRAFFLLVSFYDSLSQPSRIWGDESVSLSTATQSHHDVVLEITWNVRRCNTDRATAAFWKATVASSPAARTAQLGEGRPTEL